MNTHILVAALLRAMLLWQPLDRVQPWPELRHETQEARLERYRIAAEDAALVAFDPTRRPLFKGSRARGRTAALYLAIGKHETAFHNQVVTLAPEGGRADGLKSWCMGQILIGRSGVTRGRTDHVGLMIPEGWSGQELEADPIKCFTVVHRYAAASFKSCAGGSLLGRYSGEGCNVADAVKSEEIMALARSVTVPPDALVLAEANDHPAPPADAPPF